MLPNRTQRVDQVNDFQARNPRCAGASLQQPRLPAQLATSETRLKLVESLECRTSYRFPSSKPTVRRREPATASLAGPASNVRDSTEIGRVSRGTSAAGQ